MSDRSRSFLRGWARARCYENEGTNGGRNGLGCEVFRVLEPKGTHVNIVCEMRRFIGGPGTPLVKAKGGELNGDSPPKTLTAAASTEYCPFGSVARSYSSTILPFDSVVAVIVISLAPSP